MEVTAGNQFAVQGDSVKLTAAINNRLGLNVTTDDGNFNGIQFQVDSLKKNINRSKTIQVFLNASTRNLELSKPDFYSDWEKKLA